MRRWFILLLVLSFALTSRPYLAPGQQGKLSRQLDAVLRHQPAGETQLVWVFFRDKGERPGDRLQEAEAHLSARALTRRAMRSEAGLLVGLEDLPLVRPYVEEVARHVTRMRQESRWFNAVSVEATAEQVKILERLPFVARLDVVRRYRRSREERSAPVDIGPVGTDLGAALRPGEEFEINYGPSLGQLSQMNVPPVHSMGFTGKGVLVAVFDAGFNNLAHESFSSLKVVATRDFVNGGTNVGDGFGRMGEGSHGTETLSCVGAFKDGRLIGPAFEASFLLAKTENTQSETPVEEDNWAAAAEWVEGMGADVISSSLGYLDFDRPFTSYTFEDMDGMTAISTRAADLAASRGVVVVNSAGNAFFNPFHNTLGAPADGIRVIATGAVNSSGLRVAFSSVGPTADGRIKPDVMAQGSGVLVAAPRVANGYLLADGTSFSCPLTAGVVALILQAHPTYTVNQVIALLRSTSSNAAAPNNLFGWGIVNALAAVQAQPPAP